MEVSILDVCFSPPLSRGSPPPPANHPYEITCGTGKKLSKMAGNSASKPLNCTPNELPCITVEWWRIAWKKLCAFSRYTAFNISNRYFSILIARIRPLLANPVTYIYSYGIVHAMQGVCNKP